MQSNDFNLLLSSLPPDSQAKAVRSMIRVGLPFKTVLYKADEAPTYAYFLTRGLASMVATTREGLSAEIGMVGREGLVGALHLLGPGTDPADSFMQTDGAAWRIPLTDLKDLLDTSPDLQQRVLEFAQVYCFTLTEVARCNRLHEAKARLARWLLMAADRLEASSLPFTHELMGILVGATRPTVSVTLRELQLDGVVESIRGRLSIPRPSELERLACGCLPTIRQRTQGLYKTSSRSKTDPIEGL